MSTQRSDHRRDRSLDAVRAVAVLAMVVAHFAPSGGPGGVLDLSEYLAAPLFAFVIGWSASLAEDRPGRSRRTRAAVVRGVVLLVIGLWLQPRTDQIYVVLPWLGLVVLAVGFLVRLRSRWVVLVTAVLLVAEPTLMARGQDWLATRTGEGLRLTPIGLVAPAWDQVAPTAVELLVAGAPYRVTWLLPLALIGVLVHRHAASGKAAMIAGELGWIVAVVLLGLGDADLVRLDPYSGRYAVLVLDVALVVAVGLTVYWSARWLPALGGLLGPCGATALSVYVAQVLGSAAWVRWVASPGPGGVVTDDSWALLGLMVLGSLLAPWAWTALLGRTPLAAGPLEAPLSALTGSRTAPRGRTSPQRTARTR